MQGFGRIGRRTIAVSFEISYSEYRVDSLVCADVLTRINDQCILDLHTQVIWRDLQGFVMKRLGRVTSMYMHSVVQYNACLQHPQRRAPPGEYSQLNIPIEQLVIRSPGSALSLRDSTTILGWEIFDDILQRSCWPSMCGKLDFR